VNIFLFIVIVVLLLIIFSQKLQISEHHKQLKDLDDKHFIEIYDLKKELRKYVGSLPGDEIDKKTNKYNDWLNLTEVNHIDSEYLYPKEEITLINNPFARKKAVLTGILSKYENRNSIAKILWELGTDVDTAIGIYTNIVIKGSNFGQEKIKEVKRLRNGGQFIEVLEEHEFYKILEKALSSYYDRNLLEGANIFVTGSFKYYDSANLKKLLSDNGANIMSRVLYKTDLFVVGEKPNDKHIEIANSLKNEGKSNLVFITEQNILDTIGIIGRLK